LAFQRDFFFVVAAKTPFSIGGEKKEPVKGNG
jgi:hypothetical protein